MPTPPHRTIETPRLILRGGTPTDAEALFDCFRDAETMRYWNTPPHTTISTTQHWLNSMISGPNNGTLDFLITLKPPSPATGTAAPQVIGKAGIWHDSEIGFLLHRGFWGCGYATEAAGAVLDLAFECGCEDVVADVDPRNEASLRVLRRLGFEVYRTEERTFEVGGVWVDSVYLRLERDVWVGRRGGEADGVEVGRAG